VLPGLVVPGRQPSLPPLSSVGSDRC
jgi:hypothetical protein